MIKPFVLDGHNGYLALDEVKKQGVFVWFYEDTKKIEFYQVWEGKKKGVVGIHKDGDRRWNKSINCTPAIAEDLIEAIRKVAGGSQVEEIDEIGDLMKELRR